jgi:hypothetical protein
MVTQRPSFRAWATFVCKTNGVDGSGQLPNILPPLKPPKSMTRSLLVSNSLQQMFTPNKSLEHVTKSVLADEEAPSPENAATDLPNHQVNPRAYTLAFVGCSYPFRVISVS